MDDSISQLPSLRCSLMRLGQALNFFAFGQKEIIIFKKFYQWITELSYELLKDPKPQNAMDNFSNQLIFIQDTNKQKQKKEHLYNLFLKSTINKKELRTSFEAPDA